ncbi:YkvA family protein [Pontibacillus salicampi]|uniref:YkvA family protein n=1 Tax=Pontibacillus salicampi TaxID=1449801 RepID=A0ABV6LPP1_9BACI
MEGMDTHEKGKYFSPNRFWLKVGRMAKKAGQVVVYAGLLLYYTLQKDDLPVKAKTTIIGALGYFILPLDLIPDMAAGIGFTDDLSALGAALFQVAMYVDDNIKEQAKQTLRLWFGEDVDTALLDEKLQVVQKHESKETNEA